eukprot:gb/GECH01007557.1/.p1 GENE.gb/GECH01007557.1/~~gb/GECH01007557.1/.p1  ORF type:complete len:322 (+),score=71.73 gb/GECH01007557.1/:1-966(+)
MDFIKSYQSDEENSPNTEPTNNNNNSTTPIEKMEKDEEASKSETFEEFPLQNKKRNISEITSPPEIETQEQIPKTSPKSPPKRQKTKSSVTTTQSKTSSSPPPLPKEFVQMFNEKPEQLTQESEIQNRNTRIRNVPHIAGNWATHIYIPVSKTLALTQITKQVLSQSQQVLPNIQPVNDGHLHISLSRTIYLQHHQIQLFIEHLENALKGAQKFSIDFDKYEFYLNDNKTCSFVGLNVLNGFQQICAIIQRIDKVILEFGKQTFHSSPKPHLTIGWQTGDHISGLPQHKIRGEWEWCENFNGFEAEQIICKCGNKLFDFKL